MTAPSGPSPRAAAIAHHHAGALGAAQQAYTRYLQRHPDDARIWTNLGVLFRQQQKPTHALMAQERALALAPDDPAVLLNLANICSDVGAYARSESLRRQVLQQIPDDAEQQAMIGRCLRGRGDLAQAERWLSDAILRHPHDPELRIQRAFARLTAGQYSDGFADYHARWYSNELRPRDMDIPQWQGGDLTDKTLLVLPEQGMGDTVLFSRFLPVLEGTGARVLLPVRAPLARVLAGVRGPVWVGTQPPPEERPDLWCNLLDLAEPHFAKDSVPPPPARLTLPESSRQRAKALLRPYETAFRIGVNWTGSVSYKANAARSCRPDHFLPLAALPGVQLVSLHKGPGQQELAESGAGAFIADFAHSEQDFADCAAVMQGLDLVITTDTATAHIAGSLGVPTWVLLHWDPFWVYGLRGPSCPWYPSMRLFRQTTPQDWAGVFAQVQEALTELRGQDAC